MGSWLKLIGKELVFIFLVLSYAFGNNYNRKHFKLMSSFGDTLYAFPHQLNSRQRQTRDAAGETNKLTPEQSVGNKRTYENSHAASSTNKSCCKASCITRRKRGSSSSSVYRLPLRPLRRDVTNVTNIRTKRLIIDDEVYDLATGRLVRSVSPYRLLHREAKPDTDDILNSIGGDLMRIQSEIIKSANKVKEPLMTTDELIKNLKRINSNDNTMAESILLKENKNKNERVVKVSNTNILENAFHHLTSKNHIMHAKHELVNENDVERNRKPTNVPRPGLLSFFKDEGEPTVSVVNQTYDEHEDDPFQGTVVKSENSPIVKQLMQKNFDDYENEVSANKANVSKKRRIEEASANVRSHITRSLNTSQDSNNQSNSSSLANSDDKVALDPRTGHGISIKSIFANAVEEAIESAEESVVKNVIEHRDTVPLENISRKESTTPNIDPVEKFLNESNSFSPSLPGVQPNGEADNSSRTNPKSAIGEGNATRFKISDVSSKNFSQDGKLMNIDDIVAKTLSNTIANHGNVEKTDVPPVNATNSKPNGGDIVHSTRNVSETGDSGDSKTGDSKDSRPGDSKDSKTGDSGDSKRSDSGDSKSLLNDDYLVNNESKTEIIKEPIISPIGEDYIESDMPRLKEPLGDEYVETGEYLSSKTILPLDVDVSMQQQNILPDDEKVHSILREKDPIRSNYIHEHKDLNKEILDLIQSYYRTGGRKHLKDIYRDSKWNHANRNRIEFFNAVDKDSIGAVCMDGSRPGYYLRKGFDTGADKWIIHLHGGAWCYNLQTCFKRRNTILGSTKGYSREDISKFFHGILSKNADENPDFFKWNIAVLSYCDGGLFSGNRKMFLMGKGKKFYFRGRRVLRLLMENLRRQQSLQKAKEVILSGTSAGGLALILQGDYIRKFIPKNIKVRGLADAAFFLDQKKNGVHANRMAHKQFKALYELHRPVLKKKCVDSYPKKDRYLCLFPQNTIHFVKLPLFIVNSLYDHWQLSYLEGVNCIYDNNECKTQQRDHILNFRNRMYSTLNDVKTFKNNTGVFANSCIAHGQVILDYTWARSKIDNTSIAEAFAQWYNNSGEEDSDGVNFHADCKYPCNGSCPRTLAQTCVENFKAVSPIQRDKSLNLC